MKLLYPVTVSLLAAAATANPLPKRNGVAWNYNTQTIYGVNLGGWLVTEPWITPSIYDQANYNTGHTIVDEWTLCEFDPNAATVLKNHWDTWVQVSDIKKIAEIGFNMIRIPIGYWAFQKYPGDPFITGAAPYLDLAIGWARTFGLKVWIDLHGAPASQNGFDNSGHNGTVGWSGPGDSVADTRAVVQLIANKYAQPNYADVVIGIELLNEPLLPKLPGGQSTLYQFYNDGYGDVRIINLDTPVIISDAFQNGAALDSVLPPSSAELVVVDHHEYQVFTDQLVALTPAEHIAMVCPNSASYATNVNHWPVVGEWSGAMTDCARYLNGYGVGSRYEGTYYGSSGPTGRSCSGINDFNSWTSTMKSQYAKFINVQLDTYSQRAKGSIWWNFKTEGGAPEWDAFFLYDRGIFPSLKNRKPTSICSG